MPHEKSILNPPRLEIEKKEPNLMEMVPPGSYSRSGS